MIDRRIPFRIKFDRQCKIMLLKELRLFLSTLDAASFVDTNRTGTVGTGPSQFFIPYEFSNTKIPDLSKVFNHAHVVLGSVSLVQMFEIVAGEISTFVTKSSSVFTKDFARLNLASNTGNRLVGICSPAADTVVLLSQIGHANAAVHSARGYKRNLT